MSWVLSGMPASRDAAYGLQWHPHIQFWRIVELRDAAVVLGVPADATADQVRSAFRARARLLHPDRMASASSTDRVAAQAAMAQLNEANETFAAHFQRGGANRPAPEPKPRHSQGEYKLLDRFEVMLCPDFGRSVMGTLLVLLFDDGDVVPIFGSHESDLRGEPLVTRPIAVRQGEKAKRGGRIDIFGGGYVLVRGGKSRAEDLLALLTAPPPKAPPPKAQPKPASPPPKPRPAPPTGQERAPISKVVPELANIAQGASRFTIEVSPGQVDICSCLTSCNDRDTHRCALGVSEAADLAAVLTREGEAWNPTPLPLPEDLDDLTVRRINPGERPAAVLLDWRSSFPDSEGEGRSAWPCVTLLLRGSADQPSTTLAAIVRVLSSAAAIADDWDEGRISREDARRRLLDT